MSNHQKLARLSAWPAAVLLLLLSLAYLLSYAPVVRMQGSWTVYATTDLLGNPAAVRAPIYSDDLPMYRPVDCLIDHTPFRDPVLWWAEQCGVGSPFREAMMWRRAGTTWP